MLDDGSVRKPTGPCEMKGTVTEDEIPTPARRACSSSAEGVAYPPPETWPTGRLLSVERRGWSGPGEKERAIRERLDMSPTRYYQLLNALLDDPVALAHDPVTVNRLRRRREAQRARR